MPGPDVQGAMQVSGDLAGALQDLLRQLIDRVLGAPAKGKGGEPLRDVVYMQLPLGLSIDPRDFSFPWDPGGGDSSADYQDDGKQGAAAVQDAAKTGATSGNAKLAHAIQSARNTATLLDQMMRVTDDGSYRPFTSAGTISSSYEAIMTKAQGIPAPPLPPDIQKQIDEAMRVLYVYDDAGNQKGKTKAYKSYQALKQAYTDAEAAYANAYAAGLGNAALGAVLPVTLKSLKTAVDNAYDDWRTADAEKIENALETVKAVGGSIGSHFLAQARALFDAWSIPLAGAVAVGTPYTQVMPSSWYDPNDTENGFTGVTASHSGFQSQSSSHSAEAASSWYKGHSSSTSGGGGGMICGVTFGATGGSSSTDTHSGSTASGSSASSFGAQMANVSIKLEFGLCTIYRPWLLRELFVIDGWYLPGEKANVVSDGTIGGQKGDDDKHLLPMIPTQFLVVRNVKITADGWGEAGNQMSSYSKQASADTSSSSWKMSGGVGFLSFGGTVSHESADWAGDDARSESAAGSSFFQGDANHGTLTINGCQIVGFIGEILPASPRVDGTKQAAAGTGTQPTATQPTSGSGQPASPPASPPSSPPPA